MIYLFYFYQVCLLVPFLILHFFTPTTTLYFSDGVLVGSADTFYHNDVFTFPVPYNEDTRCDSDFLVLLRTDSYPAETTWRVTNASGQTVVSGKFHHSMIMIHLYATYNSYLMA